MGPAKKFLLGFMVIYLILAIPIVVMFGPPGFTPEFREANQAEIDHYYEVIKDPIYKQWTQRPAFIEAQPELFTAEFQGNLAFVQEFGSSEAFTSELRRRAYFEILFNFLNATGTIIIMVRFGRKPLLDFLGRQVAEVRSEIENAEQTHQEASAARRAAEEQMVTLEGESSALIAQAEAARQEAVSTLDAETATMMEALEQDLELRKRIEVQRAAMALKQELVEEASKRVAQTLAADRTPGRERLLVSQFLEGLGGAAK